INIILEECPLYEQTNILALLEWFANAVNIQNNNIIELTFDPESDYGSHHYGNFERLLNPLPEGYQYYTVGNINKETSTPLPSCVADDQGWSPQWNKARIIFRVREGYGQIDQVYITRHYNSRKRGYDPDHTYQVTVNLLRGLRRHSTYEMDFSDENTGTGPFGNVSAHLQGQRYMPSTNHNGDSFLWMICKAILFIIIIFVLSFLGIMINIK
uniref:Uncharacterized protein n=1 Tax=Cyprinodon variegatus TaxID=28743 RepID=A0A3Q2DN74_CYPVA